MTEIARAMVLAAGLGLRMRPLTEDLPKPLIELYGRTLLDRALDHLATAGVGRTVVNTHYLAEMIHSHLDGNECVVVSHEPDLLDTGGGVANALAHLGTRAFFAVNSDAVWIDGPSPALVRLAEIWNGRRMDALLLFQPTVYATGYRGVGDYFLAPDGAARRRREQQVAPYLFAGVQILHPRLFRDAPEGAYSLNLLFDRAEEAGRLYGVVHDGDWFHVGTPGDLARTEAALALRRVAVQSR